MGRPEQHVIALAVLEPEQVGAVLDPPVGQLVRFARQQRREVHLLGADGVHLLADDVLDLVQHPQPERQPGVDARSGTTDVSGAHQPAMAGHLGVRRVLAQGADEQLGHLGDHRGLPGVDGQADSTAPQRAQPTVIPSAPRARTVLIVRVRARSRVARSTPAGTGASPARAAVTCTSRIGRPAAYRVT
ncbi:hypothetical protein SDC9_139374 [bioreactor metagenome]|uniref:Uncharacterized protein n=1 Tax=bioreactor metagenome TaxID=1076179 RepID=A0A645DSJ1_9ZZZZ